MSKPQYAILRFAKYKAPAISGIEAHNERAKEAYASNPDIDPARSKYNIHLIAPADKYRREAERQIAAAGCRTRKDSVKLVEALITATPEFFAGKKKAQVRAFFEEALSFIEKHQSKDTIISAVIHMDEKTPHMHLCFVPLTADGRLSAKEILGNRKKLTKWQDDFWAHMVKKFPELERGESASVTGNKHIPMRVFKQMESLRKEKEQLEDLLTGINPLNAKSRTEAISKLLDSYIPNVSRMQEQLKKYQLAFSETTTENKRLKKRNKQLKEELDSANQSSTLERLQELKLLKDGEAAVELLSKIPPEIIAAYRNGGVQDKEKTEERG